MVGAQPEAYSQEPALTISADLFELLQDFQTYYPHPTWIMKKMMNLSLQEFQDFFAVLAVVVGNKLERWQYLYTKKEQFKDDLVDATTMVEHFSMYHSYFERLAIRADGTFKLFDKKIYHVQDFESDGEHYTPLLAFLKMSTPQEFALLYATYFSYLSRCFIDNVKDYSHTKDASLKRQADQQLMWMIDVFSSCLRETEYEGRVMQSLMRYYTLFIDMENV